MHFFVPVRSTEEIQTAAQDFLAKHWDGKTIPVPIEEIIEFELGLTIKPFKGLFDRFEIEAFLSQDMRIITVDNARMQSYCLANRYRFTLGHEVGHLKLHADFIRYRPDLSVGEWKSEFIKRSQAKRMDSRLELQANEFSGQILVPSSHLREVWNASYSVIGEKGYDLIELMECGMMEYAIQIRTKWIAEIFNVSNEVVRIRLNREGLLNEPAFNKSERQKKNHSGVQPAMIF